MQTGSPRLGATGPRDLLPPVLVALWGVGTSMKKHLQVSDEEFWGDYYRLSAWEMVHKYDSVYFWGTLIYGGVCLVGGVVGGIFIVLNR